jgi:hypothetical protein
MYGILVRYATSHKKRRRTTQQTNQQVVKPTTTPFSQRYPTMAKVELQCDSTLASASNDSETQCKLILSFFLSKDRSFMSNNVVFCHRPCFIGWREEKTIFTSLVTDCDQLLSNCFGFLFKEFDLYDVQRPICFELFSFPSLL